MRLVMMYHYMFFHVYVLHSSHLIKLLFILNLLWLDYSFRKRTESKKEVN